MTKEELTKDIYKRISVTCDRIDGHQEVSLEWFQAYVSYLKVLGDVLSEVAWINPVSRSLSSSPNDSTGSQGDEE